MIKLTDTEWLVLSTLANGYVRDLHAKGDQYKQVFESIIQYADDWSLKKFRLLLWALEHRSATLALIGSTKLVTEMDESEICQLVVGLNNSSLASLRKFSSLVRAVAAQCLYRMNEEFLRKYCIDEATNPQLLQFRSQNQVENPVWELPDMHIDLTLRKNSPSINAEIAIVGTGCAAMVAAYLLSAQGFRVLLIERGKHVTCKNTPTKDADRDQQTLINGGFKFTHDLSVAILAGATVGGGGAVNWSCSVPTPQHVRDLWARNGFPLAADPLFDEGYRVVKDVMKMNKTAKHSFSNRTLYEGATKLGYPVIETLQNTGKHAPNIGFIEFGERSGPEKGGVAEWLRVACQNGAQILPEAEVTKIRHRGGRATGLDVIVNRGGHKTSLLVNCKHVVCAGGAISTPHLLLRSKFRNKHIGRGLNLHPTVVSFGQFDQDVQRRDDATMTTLCSKNLDADGAGHGCALETIQQRSNYLLNYLPWRNPQDWQNKTHRLKQTCCLLNFVGTKGEGRVSLDIDHPECPRVDYTPIAEDMELLKKGILTASDILYIQGAKCIFSCNIRIPDFESDKPVAERSFYDPQFQKWRKNVESLALNPLETTMCSAHQMASCRINEWGSGYGAVDARGRLYECQNVHVIDTSVFPSSSIVNPMISCMTVAYGLTKYMIEDLRKSDFKL